MNDFNYNEGEEFNEAQKAEFIEERKKLRKLLETKIGREHIFSMLEESFIFTSTFTGNSKTFFNEGKREGALKAFNAILDLDPIIFAKMCKEFRNKND
jgi:hypothetical protein